MSNKREITDEIRDLDTLHTLVETYQEIAATRMQKVKKSVLTNRNFLAGLEEMFIEVRTSHAKEIDRLKKENKKNEVKGLTFTVEYDKTVTVLLSSNTMLYGDIIRKTFKEFLKTVQETDTDIVIVGKVGLRLYKEANVQMEYEYFDFSDAGIDSENLKKIVEHVMKYSKIRVVHGQFESVLSQIAAHTYVRGNLEDLGLSEKAQKYREQVRYIFEPSLKDVLVFFETELLASIMEQAVFESNLAKFASRMVSLDSAVQSIGDRLHEVEQLYSKIEKGIFNRKQQGSLAGMALWEN